MFMCRLPLGFISFYFVSSRVTFLCALSWHRLLLYFFLCSRFSTLVWHISRCPISMFAPLWSSMRLLFVVIVFVIAVVLYLYTLLLLIALSSCFDCLFVCSNRFCMPFATTMAMTATTMAWRKLKKTVAESYERALKSALSLLIHMSCDCRYIFGCILCVCVLFCMLNYFMFIVLNMFAPQSHRVRERLQRSYLCIYHECNFKRYSKTPTNTKPIQCGREEEKEQRIQYNLRFDWY